MAPTIIERQAPLSERDALEQMLTAIPRQAQKMKLLVDGESFIETIQRALEYYGEHRNQMPEAHWETLLDYAQAYALKTSLQEELKDIRIHWNQSRIQYLELKLENRYTLEHFKLDTPETIQAKVQELEEETREFSLRYQDKLLELDQQKQAVLEMQRKAEVVLQKLGYQ